jgi:RNA polymerase sigma-70 factor (ECF subfamily)
MLAEDATFSMPPLTAWFRGRAAIRTFLPTGPLSIPRRFTPTTANGQLAFATYRWVAEEARYVPNAIHIITLRGAEIADATAFLMTELFPRFGLPMTPGGEPGLSEHELPPPPGAAPRGGRAAGR